MQLKGVNRFTQLADDSDAVPNLDKREYSDYRISALEWAKMELMRDVLQVSLFRLLSSL